MTSAQTIENAKPYELFDGFTKANIAVKALYILSFPSLLVPAMIEMLEYSSAQAKMQNQQHNQMLAKIQSVVQTPLTGDPHVQEIDRQLTQTGKSFQQALNADRSPSAEHTR